MLHSDSRSVSGSLYLSDTAANVSCQISEKAMAFPPPRDETLHGTRLTRVRNRGILDVPPYDVAVIQPHIGRYSLSGIDKLPPGPTFSLFLPFRNRPRLTPRGGAMIGTR